MTKGAMGTSSLMYYIYTLGFENYKMGYASALAWVMFILILGFTILRFVLRRKEQCEEKNYANIFKTFKYEN